MPPDGVISRSGRSAPIHSPSAMGTAAQPDQRAGPRQRTKSNRPSARMGNTPAPGLGTCPTAPGRPAITPATARIQLSPSAMSQSPTLDRPKGHRQAASTAAGMTRIPITGTARRFATSP